MHKRIFIVLVLMAVCCTAYAGPHGGPGPGGFRGPSRPRYGAPPPPRAYNPGGRSLAPSRGYTSSNSNGIFDNTVQGIYQHLDLSYNDAYKAALVLAEGFHKDEAANQLVASGTALQDISDQRARDNLHVAMQKCLPTNDELAMMYIEHQEQLRQIMQEAKSYQKSTNKHFGWFGVNLVLAVAVCPSERRSELLRIIGDAQASIKKTKAMFKNFDASYKSMEQLLGKDDMKEIRKRANELKKHEENSYGLST